MSLGVSAAWLKAMRRSTVKPVTLVQLDLDNAGTTFKFIRASGRPLPYPNSVLDYVPVAHRRDPFTRQIGNGELTIKFKNDPHFRRINKNYRIKGKRIILTLGCPELTEGQYEDLWRGTVIDVVPKKDHFAVKCKVAFSRTQKKLFTGWWWNAHPLEMIHEVLAEGPLQTDLYDASSLDPDADVAISHFNTARAIHGPYDRRIHEPEDSMGVINELATLLNGGFDPMESGKLRFTRFDYTKAVNATWAKREIRSLDVMSVQANLVNKVSILFDWVGKGGSKESIEETGTGDTEYRVRVDLDDTTSQGNYKYPGSSGDEDGKTFKTKWLGVRSKLKESITGTPGSFILKGGMVSAFCGLRASEDGGAINAGLSAARPAYIKIDEEIIRCETVVASTDSEVFDPAGPDEGVGQPPVVEGGTTTTGGNHDGTKSAPGGYVNIDQAEFTITARAQFGTSQVDHSAGTQAIDITIATALVTGLIDRFSDGVVMMRVTTPLYLHDSQVGDFVALPDDVYSRFGYDELTTAVKFEITGKEINAHASPPVITWTLAEVRVPPGYTKAWVIDSLQGSLLVDSLSDKMFDGTLIDPFIKTGFVITDGGGLTLNIAVGEALGHGADATLQAMAVTLKANKDCYIGVDQYRRGVVVEYITTGDPEPSLGPYEVRIGKAVCSAGIDSVEDFRELVGFIGSTLKGFPGIQQTTTPDRNLVDGQLWYDSTTRKTFRYDSVAEDYEDAVLADSPILFWRLDETVLALALDASGNGHLGVHENAPDIDQTKLISDDGRSVLYNSGGPTNHRTRRTTFAGINSASSISVEFWIKTSDTEGFIFDYDTTHDFAIQLTAGVGLRIHIKGNTYDFDTSVDFNDGTTHHVVVSWNGTFAHLSIWIDGEAKQTIRGVQPGSTLATNKLLTIAQNSDGFPGADVFTGTLDELAVYTFLDEERIREHFRIGNAGQRLWLDTTPFNFIDDFSQVLISMDDIKDSTAFQKLTGLLGGLATMESMSTALLKGFFAYRTGSVQSVGATTWVKAQLNGENWDNGNMFDSVTNYRGTVPAGGAGLWIIYWRFEFAGTAAAKTMSSQLRVNGSTTTGSPYGSSLHGGSAGAIGGPGIVILDLAVGDYIELWVYNGDSGAQNLSLGDWLTYMGAQRIFGES